MEATFSQDMLQSDNLHTTDYSLKERNERSMWLRLEDVPFIPKPQSVITTDTHLSSGSDSKDPNTYFELTDNIMLCFDDAYSSLEQNQRNVKKDFDNIIRYLARLLWGSNVDAKIDSQMIKNGDNCFCSRDIQRGFDDPKNPILLLSLIPLGHDLEDEGYIIKIEPNSLSLMASSPNGLMNSIQTLRQILPPEYETNTFFHSDGKNKNKKNNSMLWNIPCGIIQDSPRYAFRSTMLDVSRHFFPVDEIKRYIDIISLYKINFLHLHLSDDQGWRIEIKSWPNLAKHGGQTQVGDRTKGGYYSQEDYSSIVQYASERFITIIPEIEMPGHTNAALSSYAELNCNGVAPKPYIGTKVGFSSLCLTKKVALQFAEDVIREISSLTPGPYIHIGGDESKATPKNEYISFVEEVQNIVQSFGKEMIGWEEVAEANLSSTSVVQVWQPNKNGVRRKNTTKEASNSNKSLYILSPADKIYLDMKYNSNTRIGLHWAGFIPVNVAYDWEVPPDKEIIGIEAPLWTETIENRNDIDYMAFPRLIGVAEIGWSHSSSGKSWDEYKMRLGKQKKRLELLGINYYPSPLVPWTDDIFNDNTQNCNIEQK